MLGHGGLWWMTWARTCLSTLLLLTRNKRISWVMETVETDSRPRALSAVISNIDHWHCFALKLGRNEGRDLQSSSEATVSASQTKVQFHPIFLPPKSALLSLEAHSTEEYCGYQPKFSEDCVTNSRCVTKLRCVDVDGARFNSRVRSLTLG